MGSPGTVLRGLVRVSGGPERVHGVPKLEILSFLQPLMMCFARFPRSPVTAFAIRQTIHVINRQ